MDNAHRSGMRLLAGLLLLVCGGWAPAWSGRHMLVLAGQSNMVGQALRAGQELPDSFPKVQVFDLKGTLKDSWITLRPGLGQDTSRFGVEVTLATTLVDSLPQDTFYLVKAAESATSLYEYWHSWSPTGEAGSLYAWMIQGVRRALDSMEGPLPPIDGFFWMQGESDALFEEFAEAYQEYFDAFVRDLRVDWKDSTLPVVVGLIDKQPVWPYASLVREAQITTCDAYRYTGKVETGGLETDGVHYTASGLKELGRRMAEAWLNVYKKRPKPVPTDVVRRARGSEPRMLDGSRPARFRMVRIDGRAGAWQSMESWSEMARGRSDASGVVLVQWVGERGIVETVRMAPRM